MKIKDKLHGIEIVDKERPIKDINFILRNDAPDALLVMDKGKIAGIVTDSDLVMKVNRKNLNSDNIKVKDIMSSPVISIESNRDIKEAIDLMARKKIQKLLVTENGSPIGVLFGEEILELDEEKWKEIVFEQTIEEVCSKTISFHFSSSSSRISSPKRTPMGLPFSVTRSFCIFFLAIKS